MEGQELVEGLPKWMQMVGAIIFFCGAGLAGIFGYLKPKLSKSLDDQKNSDAVVISAAFADGRVIAGLTKAVEELVEISKQNHVAAESQTRAINFATEELRRLTIELVRGK